MNGLESVSSPLHTIAATTTGSQFGNFTVDPLRDLIRGIDRLDILNHPDQFLTTLGDLHAIWGFIFVILGLLSLFNGYQWHRWIVMIISFIIGIEVGRLFNASDEVTLVIALCIGVLTAVVAWPLMRYAVTVCGALSGAIVGANLWTAFGLPPEGHLAGAAMGFITFGMMSFLAYGIIIIAMTCVAGAFVFIVGALSLVMNVDGWAGGVRSSLVGNPEVIPLIALVVAVIGFVAQSGGLFAGAAERERNGKARPAAA